MRTIVKATLGLLLAVAAVGCGQSAPPTLAERIETKKADWQQRQREAEERLAELDATLTPAQRKRFKAQLQSEYEVGMRSLAATNLQ